jgi:hypothetical protein
MDVRSYSTTIAQIFKRKLTVNPVERPQGSMESFVNVSKQRSTKNAIPNEWKTLWMVLYNDRIIFFKSENKEKPKAVIFHSTIKSVLALENEISNISNWFEIVTKKYTYVIHAFHNRYKTERLLYCWLVAIHNSLTQSLNDWRDTENIDKLTLQIENYNQKISSRKRQIRLQKEKDRKKEKTEGKDPFAIQSVPDIILMMFPTTSTENANPSVHYNRRSDRRYNRDTSCNQRRDTADRRRPRPLSVRDKPRTRTNLLQITPQANKIEDLSSASNLSESLIISETTEESTSPRSDQCKQQQLHSKPFSEYNITTEPPNRTITKLYSSSRSLIPELEGSQEKENRTPRTRTTNSLSKNDTDEN